MIKEGKYVLERSIDITQQSVIIGHGKVTIECRSRAPFRFLVACYVATPADKDHKSDECKMN